MGDGGEGFVDLAVPNIALIDDFNAVATSIPLPD
jgi:hypothetical protein